MRKASIMMKRRMSRAQSLTAQMKNPLMLRGQKRKLMPRHQPQSPRQVEKIMSPLSKWKELPTKTLLRKRKSRKVMNMIANTMKKEGTSGAKKAKTGNSTTRRIRNRMKEASLPYPKH